MDGNRVSDSTVCVLEGEAPGAEAVGRNIWKGGRGEGTEAAAGRLCREQR